MAAEDEDPWWEIGPDWINISFVLMTIVILSATALIYGFSVGYFTDVSNRIQMTAMFVNILLTLTLIHVYTDVANALSGQEELLENQEELIELQYAPRIRVTDLKYDDIGSKVQIQLRNFGNGLAENLMIRTDFTIKKTDDEDENVMITVDPIEEQTTIGSSITIPNLRDAESDENDNITINAGYWDIGWEDDDSEHLLGYGGAQLPPEDDEVWFRTQPSVRFTERKKSTHPKGGPALNSVSDFEEAGYDNISIYLTVVYTDLAGNSYCSFAFGTPINLQKGETEDLDWEYILEKSPFRETPRIDNIRKDVEKSKEAWLR